jgi:hypothetical protein
MDKENLADYLESIPKPGPTIPPEQKILKISLITARRSASIGFWLVALPGLIILLFIGQNLFHLFPDFTLWLARNAPSLSITTRAVLVFIFLVGFPVIAIVLNLMSICHFQYDKTKREFTVTFKIRWRNVVITLAGGALASFYILHLLADTLLGDK